MALTRLTIDKAIPRADGKPLKLSDGLGLALWVMPNGGKYWRLKYRVNGKEKLLALGVYPAVAIKEAREKRDEARRMLAGGVDPGAQRKAAKLARQLADGNSFEAIAREWHRVKAAEWAPRHSAAVLTSLERYLFPAIGGKPVTEVAPLEVLSALRAVEADGKHDTAKRLRERCSSVFRLAISTGRAQFNPAADLVGALQSPASAPRPALGREELPGFLHALEADQGVTLQTKLLFRVLMLCLTRVGETVRAEWAHVDFERGVWVIPAENRKLKHKLKPTANAHIVPLTRQAAEAFRQLEAMRWRSQYVFPGMRAAGRHMSEATPLKALERMGYGGRNQVHGHIVTHGFRATASTILNEAGFNPDAIERQLSHVERGMVRAAYNRAQYLEERRVMLQEWADYLDELAAGGEATAWRVSVAGS